MSKLRNDSWDIPDNWDVSYQKLIAQKKKRSKNKQWNFICKILKQLAVVPRKENGDLGDVDFTTLTEKLDKIE